MGVWPQAPGSQSNSVAFLETMLHHLNSEQQISWKKGHEIIHFFYWGKKLRKEKSSGTRKDFTD